MTYSRLRLDLRIFATTKPTFNYFGHFYNYDATIKNFIPLATSILHLFSSINKLICPISRNSHQISCILKVFYNDIGVYFSVCTKIIYISVNPVHNARIQFLFHKKISNSYWKLTFYIQKPPFKIFLWNCNKNWSQDKSLRVRQRCQKSSEGHVVIRASPSTFSRWPCTGNLGCCSSIKSSESMGRLLVPSNNRQLWKPWRSPGTV